MRRQPPSCAGLSLAVSGATAAPPGRPSDAVRPPDSSFQKVTLNDLPGEPMSLAVLPDRRVLHTARTGEVRIHDPRTGLQHPRRRRPRLPARRGGPAGHRDRPGLPPQQLGLPLLLAAAEHAGRRPGHARASTRATRPSRAPRPTSRRSRACCGCPGSSWSATRSTWAPSSRSSTCRSTAASAATSAARSTSTARATSTCPPATTPTRSTPTATRRSTSAPTATRPSTPSAPPATPTTCAASCCGSGSSRGGGYTIPRGNLFRPGTPKTRPEIYAMGLRNPFRFAVDRDDRPRLHRRLLAGRPRGRTRRAGRPGTAAGWSSTSRRNYGWPYCVTPDLPYVDYDFATGTLGRAVQLRAAGERLAAQHRPRGAAAGGAAGGLVLVRASPLPELPGTGHRRHRPDGRPGVRLRARRAGRGSSGRGTTTACRCSTSGPATTSRRSTLDRRNGTSAGSTPVLPSFVFDNPMDMEFGPDGALYVLEYGDGFFAENPDAQLARIDFVRGNRTPVPTVSGRRRPAGLAPLTVTFSSAGTADPDGDALRVRVGLRRRRDGRLHRRRTRRTRTPRTATTDATLKVTDSHRPLGRGVGADRRRERAPVVELTTRRRRASRSSSATR